MVHRTGVQALRVEQHRAQAFAAALLFTALTLVITAEIHEEQDGTEDE